MKEIFDKKSVVVFGGAGFIGSNLCDRLLNDSKVICIDNFLTSFEDNINHLLNHSDFEFIKHDIIEPCDLEQIMELEKFKIQWQGIQEVYHLASPSSPLDRQKYPLETLLANVYGTKNALDLAVKYQAKFLYVSSGMVYGPGTQGVEFKENVLGVFDHLAPDNLYAESKRFGETLVNSYHLKHNLDVKIARVFNTYGSRMKLKDGKFLSDTVLLALENKPIHIRSTSSKILGSYCYVDDLVDGLLRLMGSSINHPVNLGHSLEYSIKDIVDKIVALTNSKSEIIINDQQTATYHDQEIPNIALATELLGWFPVVLLNQGLKKTIDYIKGVRSLFHSKI